MSSLPVKPTCLLSCSSRACSAACAHALKLIQRTSPPVWEALVGMSVYDLDPGDEGEYTEQLIATDYEYFVTPLRPASDAGPASRGAQASEYLSSADLLCSVDVEWLLVATAALAFVAFGTDEGAIRKNMKSEVVISLLLCLVLI